MDTYTVWYLQTVPQEISPLYTPFLPLNSCAIYQQ